MQQVYKNDMVGSTGRRSHAANSAAEPPVEQEWHRSGSCPEGTIPIRRLPKTTANPNLTIIHTLSSSQGNIVVDDVSNSPRAEVLAYILPVSCLFIFLYLRKENVNLLYFLLDTMVSIIFSKILTFTLSVCSCEVRLYFKVQL